MMIQVNTDAKIHGGEGFTAKIKEIVEATLSRFSEQITRVEVHLSEETGHEHGQDDKRCMMEARLEGHQPLAVTHHAASSDQAIDGAVEKLERLLEHTTGRLRQVR